VKDDHPSTDCSSHFDCSLGIFRQLVIHTENSANTNIINECHSYHLRMPVRGEKAKTLPYKMADDIVGK